MNKLLITVCTSSLVLNTYAGLCESREVSAQRNEYLAQRRQAEAQEGEKIVQKQAFEKLLRNFKLDNQTLIEKLPIKPLETMDELIKQKQSLLASLKTLSYKDPSLVNNTARGYIGAENTVLLTYRFLSPDESVKNKIDDTLKANEKIYDDIKDLLATTANK